MDETPNPQLQKEEEKKNKKKGVLNKLQDITPDKEEQIAIIGVAVRLGIVVWSGFCLTLAYIDLPGFPKQTFDPTFIASIFTSTLTTFGVQAASKKGGNGITKEDMEKMMASNRASSGEQVIRVQTPLKISSPDGEIAQVIESPKEKTPPPADR
tara:strand:- start:5163 stop:5624 length:462 start_codon:yes stop_codon:yes gene_type:complete